MKTVKDTLLQRRSIRRYEREDISAADMQLIYDAIRNTPTSYNGQQFSVIDITDQALKEQLYELTQQKQIKTCNHFLVFCADYNKVRKIAEYKNVEMPDFEHTADGVIVGIVDASLALMSALVAAESCGLGTCCIGYTRTAAPEAIAELLKLPKGVFIVCGLAIGIPREMPDLKPKQSEKLLIHSNCYRGDDVVKDMVDYDSKIIEFNATRSGTKSDNDWASHIVDYYNQAMNYNMLDALKNCGYDIIK
jgi:nitroreductase